MKSFAILIFVFIFVRYSLSQKGNHPIVSPISFRACGGSEKYIFVDFKPAGKPGEKILDGNFTLPFAIDANTEFEWELRWWKDGEWEKKGKIFKGKACFYLTKFAGKLWKQVRLALKPPVEHDCPIKAGTYIYGDQPTDFSDINLPMMGKGKWIGKISIAKEGKTFCGNLIVDMI